MDFLTHGGWRREEFFRQRYRPADRALYGDTRLPARHQKARVGPFVLRRLKTDKSIISDLPEKLELSEWGGAFSSEQSKLYHRKTWTNARAPSPGPPLGQEAMATCSALLQPKLKAIL